MAPTDIRDSDHEDEAGNDGGSNESPNAPDEQPLAFSNTEERHCDTDFNETSADGVEVFCNVENLQVGVRNSHLTLK